MTPRTGCTAIGEVLCEHLDGEYLPPEDIIDSDGFYLVQKKHSKIKELLEYKLLTAEELSSLYKFTSVRNPFDTLVSLYTKKRYKYASLLSDPTSWVHRFRKPNYVEDMKFCINHSFDAWIYRRFRMQIVNLLLGRGRINLYEPFTQGVDDIIRFENLQNDFHRILDKAGFKKSLRIPKINVTPNRKKDYRQYYSKVSRIMVQFIHKNDLKEYRYRF
jgi:hypothetical protein